MRTVVGRRPFYLVYDSGISKTEWNVAALTVERAASTYGNRDWLLLGMKFRLNRAAVSADRIESRASIVRDGPYGAQLDASDICEAIENSQRMAEDDFICIFLTSRDITVKGKDGEYLEYCSIHAEGRVVVISLARVKSKFPEKDKRRLMVTGLILRGLGQLYNVTRFGRQNIAKFTTEFYCTNPGCVMNYGANLDELYENFKLATILKHYYCSDCRERIHVVKG